MTDFDFPMISHTVKKIYMSKVDALDGTIALCKLK